MLVPTIASKIDMLVPTITSKDVIPDDFPVPCSWLKCAKKKDICPCRVKNMKLISCRKFCKCGALRNLVLFVQF